MHLRCIHPPQVDEGSELSYRLIMNIRLAQETDLDSILKVIETAFSDEENKVIINLVQELSRETTSPSIKSLVAEVDDEVIGYVSYSPIFLKSDSNISGYILAPVAVSPEQQKQGVGSNLIKSGIDMLTKMVLGSRWFTVTLRIMDSLGSRKRLDAGLCRHTHCNIHSVGQV